MNRLFLKIRNLSSHLHIGGSRQELTQRTLAGNTAIEK